MEVKSIIKKLNKNGITDYDILHMKVGCDVVCVRYRCGYELLNITDMFKRGVKIEINTYSKTAILWDIKEWNRASVIFDNVNILVSIFYEELRKGKNSEEAKWAQHEYAKENDMLSAFYIIYE